MGPFHPYYTFTNNSGVQPVQGVSSDAGRSKHKRRRVEGFAAEIDGELRYFESIAALQDFLAYLEKKSEDSAVQVVESVAIQVIEHGREIPKRAPERLKFNSGPVEARKVVDKFNMLLDKLFRERLAAELSEQSVERNDEIAFEMLLERL